jgi:hypothetical protein
MVCNSCKSEFDNINGLKFCPYCGTRLEEEVFVSKTEKLTETSVEETSTKSIHDTLSMPVITKEQIRKYKRDKFFKALKKPFKNSKVVITMITVILFMVMAGVSFFYFDGRAVDEAKIKDDLIGKVVILPKGTSFEIKKGYIKSFSISERNTNKSEKKDDIKAAVTLNNGTLEVKTILSMQYVYNDNKNWVISNKLSLAGDTTVKPLVGMEEKQILEGVKKLNINIGDAAKALNGEDVKTLSIASRTPDFDNLKETVLIDLRLDNGLISASGKIKCLLNFENEAWTIAGIERNSTEDFTLVLSPAFSEDKIVELIKKEALDQTVNYANVFGGKSFYINDSFTKSINAADKKYDPQSKTLNVTVKRQNTAGEVKTVLSTDYSYEVTFDKIKLLKKSKTIVDSITISDISKDFVMSSIVNAEIEGNKQFLWFSNNHKITSEEAKTFITSKESSKKGLENQKYVYGAITYNDGNKQKTTSVVAIYFLVYDNSKGYSWNLDRIVGEDSPNYKMYMTE